MTTPLFSRIAIIGLGLIGSSIARAVHERGLAKTVVGYDINELSLALARKQKCIDIATQSLAEAVKGSQLVILASPPEALAGIAEAMAPYLESGAIVMDVCSVKQPAIDAIAPHIPAGVDFIPAHPIAGSEKSGIAAGRGDLFERKRVIVTPDQPLETEALITVTAFWQRMGAHIDAMPPAVHDVIYAYVSHLPQLLAFAVAEPLAEYKDDEKLQPFLRLSGSNPAMWTEIFLLNKENVLSALDLYLDAVAHIAGELKSAPEGNASAEDEVLSHTMLFPRIAASCLITTVMQGEKQTGFPFARYAGTGFADFTNPAAVPPEEDIERISGQYSMVQGILQEYIKALSDIRAAMVKEDAGVLQRVISNQM